MASKTPIRSTTTPLSNSIFKSKHIFLHEWWLVKPPNQCKGLALAGIASMERERMFFSSVIVERHEPNVVETQDGITVMFHGLINASRTSQNGFSSEVCRRFSVGFPHNWKNYSAHSSENECENVDKVTGFDDSNTSSHKITADETSQEAEGNNNIANLRLSQPHVGVIYNGENGFSNASPHKKAADGTLQEDIEPEGNDNIAGLKLSQQEDMEPEGNNNIASLDLSQPQVDMISNGENGVSSVAAAENSQNLISVFEFDPTYEPDSLRSPLYAKKLDFDILSSDRMDKKRTKKKIVGETGNLCSSRVLTRSIAKKSHMMLKKDGKTAVKCFTSPVRRSTRLLNYQK
ncbi:putative transcription regulator Others family [Medicago truncatula]|uniref:Putative transcription regulator Others family n=1 Tax=Medicago truncatula TaxID=3880 RepID=A0A072TZN4_MEDTR|nr:kinetochore-associated protein KNL-2 homolog [Medicago truncatula]KEH22328.1 SANTA (SANT associated) protein [Medicago truncatula]RHN45474.1 putative transcription regulator Others family [Medicago truncatula]